LLFKLLLMYFAKVHHVFLFETWVIPSLFTDSPHKQTYYLIACQDSITKVFHWLFLTSELGFKIDTLAQIFLQTHNLTTKPLQFRPRDMIIS
jgi:hypothetical protein